MGQDKGGGIVYTTLVYTSFKCASVLVLLAFNVLSRLSLGQRLAAPWVLVNTANIPQVVCCSVPVLYTGTLYQHWVLAVVCCVCWSLMVLI